MQTLTSKRIAGWLACATLATTSAAQSTWYIDDDGIAPGSGTQADPYTQIQYAVSISTTLNGDRLIVAPGLYVERVNFGSKVLTLESSSGPLETEIRAAIAGPVVVSSYFGVAYLDLSGFTISGAQGLSTIGVSAGRMRVSRCIVRDHRGGPGYAGAAINSLNSMYVSECTLIGNEYGVYDHIYGGVTHLRNSIAIENGVDLAVGADDITADYSCWISDSGATIYGAHNLIVDPLLWSVGLRDCHLTPSSPCIDAGDPASPLDPDGSRIDIGALPFDATYAPPPTVYCTAKTNSIGCLPAIAATGHASASGSPFVISCSQELNHRAGLLFYGFEPNSASYQGGWLCVRAPTRRTSLLDSGGNAGADDCSGVYAFDFDAHIQSGVDPALAPGLLVYAQFWSRDSNASFATVRSDALRFGIAP